MFAASVETVGVARPVTFWLFAFNALDNVPDVIVAPDTVPPLIVPVFVVVPDNVPPLTVLFVNVSVVALPTSVSVASGNVTVRSAVGPAAIRRVS